MKEMIKSLSNGECTTNACLLEYMAKKYDLPDNFGTGSYSGGYRSYDYDVSGYDYYGDTDGYISGSIEADDGKDVSGYLTLDDGTEIYFDGEWSGKGEVEGWGDDGNYYELEVD